MTDMRKLPLFPGLLAVLLVSCAVASSAQTTFKPAEVTSASEILYPIQSIADGIVVIDVSLDTKGVIDGLNVVRDIPSLTSAATSIPSWRFSPASFQGYPVPSVLRIAVVFRPRSYLAAGPAFTPVVSEGSPNDGRHSGGLPGITAAVYPQYPVNAVMPGTVVIQVTVGKSGAMEHTKLVRDVPPFSQFGLNALNGWRFQAPTVGGKPLRSNLTIAFVFAPLLAE
jgi:outer membrane biosynthesis protein TonB